MHDTVLDLSYKFMEFYNIHIQIGEYDTLLTNGYCFYFAMLLKKIFPSGEIYYSCYNHYLFFYENEFYDGNGIVPRYNEILGLSQGFHFIKDLILIDDIQLELDRQEIFDFDYKKKERVWSILEPFLLSYAKENILRKKTLETN